MPSAPPPSERLPLDLLSTRGIEGTREKPLPSITSEYSTDRKRGQSLSLLKKLTPPSPRAEPRDEASGAEIGPETDLRATFFREVIVEM